MIELQKEDNGLWLVTLNRPEKANSLTAEMLTQLCDIAEAAHEARALVLTGAGKVFSAGADLDAARAGLATSPLWERLSGAIAALPCLALAALNGTLAGGANGMALACDMRIAVPGAKFLSGDETGLFAPTVGSRSHGGVDWPGPHQADLDRWAKNYRSRGGGR